MNSRLRKFCYQLLSVVCGYSAAVASVVCNAQVTEGTAEFFLQTRVVIQTHCHRCHNGPGSEGGDFDLLNLSVEAREYLLNASDVDKSLLMQRVTNAEMPPKPDRLFVEEGNAIRTWITAGAPNFPRAEASRPNIALDYVLSSVRDHLLTLEPDDRPYVRFFTLHNLANDSRVSDADLRMVRAALSKVVNSLSWKSTIVIPRSIEKLQVLYAIDIRDYDWDRTDAWDKLLRAYPYGLKFNNLPPEQQQLRRMDKELEQLTDCPLPLIRADWFIAAATRPPLYHDILEMPMNAGELEMRLGVHIAREFLQPSSDRIARGGFHRSGVSGQNRLVERLRSDFGYYWKSYDFLPDSARTKLTRFPLGPLNLFPKGQHPFPSQAFAHDGGEIIFTLPNRLQAYMLIDGNNNRIDEGPIQVVSDALKTSGTNAIVNGVSCMSCHKAGVIKFRDDLRSHNAVFGEAERHVQKLYPDQQTIDRLLAQDERLFVGALEKAIGPFLNVDENASRDITSFTEPVGDLARRHRLGFLDLKTVAHEVEFQESIEVKLKVGEKNFKKLGLETLLKPGGVISRLEWESSAFRPQGISLMQELARELRYDIVK